MVWSEVFLRWENESMLKAVVIQGEIRPLAPLPSDWQEGQRLRIEKADDEASADEIDHDFAVLKKLCEASELAEEEQLERALQEGRRLAKEQVRQHKELSQPSLPPVA
jgi:hypothetical protein